MRPGFPYLRGERRCSAMRVDLAYHPFPRIGKVRGPASSPARGGADATRTPLPSYRPCLRAVPVLDGAEGISLIPGQRS